MRFGTWIDMPPDPTRAMALAPLGKGVFQLRIRDGLINFPSGKSAMVAYGGGQNVGQALRELLEGEVGRRALARGPLLCRFALPGPSQDPVEAADRLRRQFQDRFGAPPAAERGD